MVLILATNSMLVIALWFYYRSILIYFCWQGLEKIRNPQIWDSLQHNKISVSRGISLGWSQDTTMIDLNTANIANRNFISICIYLRWRRQITFALTLALQCLWWYLSVNFAHISTLILRSLSTASQIIYMFIQCLEKRWKFQIQESLWCYKIFVSRGEFMGVEVGTRRW